LKDYFNDTENRAEKEAVSPDKLAGMRFVSDCSVDTDLELLLPDSYIENITERINSYRKLDNIANTEELEAFKNGLVDRFGNMPQAAEELLEVVKLRWLAMDLGIEKIFLKNNKMILHFISDSSSLFYQSPVFQQILQGVQQYHNICKIQEKNQKLVLTFEPVKSVKKALHYLSKLSPEKTPAN
jgi:transcription-repair coupling factor (superfamily II helicase)